VRVLQIIFIQTLFVFSLQAQNVFSDLQDNSEFDPAPSTQSTISERVIVKSRNRRILVITNTNQALKQGDFVTIFSAETRVAKALVAKTQERKTALKIINTFANQYDSLTNRGQSLTIVRGDAKDSPDIELTKKEESLFTTIDQIEDETEVKRMPEKSILGLGVGLYRSIDSNDQSAFYAHYVFSYAYNVSNNFWFEGNYGYSALNQFPIVDILTNLHTLRAKFKYNFYLPAYSFFMPYGGIEFTNAQASENSSLTDDQINLLQSLNQVKFIGGFSLYKRLVPGWVINLNAGTDGIYGGFSVAF